jgi:exopolyphosphatase/guanosine-5'-triphosphate,3'-diphosphate pyrophosphatase
MNTALQLAAVDLGSNSFRLEIGRVEDGHIYILDSLRSNTRLGAGLNAAKHLTEEAQAGALDALGQFGQRLHGFDSHHVRVVATNALRVAKNAAAFIHKAEKVLGHPIEVISGREEARLVFSGVAHSAPPPHVKQLVVDIGGGSTEFSVGHGFEPELMESLYMGSISSTLLHFPGGFIDEYTIKQAELAARREVQVVAKAIRASGWEVAVGSSGTARSIERVLSENRIGNGGITTEGLAWIRKAMLCAGSIDQISITGLKPDRALNLPGGLAILSAVFAELGIGSMRVSDNSLRLGVLYDLLGRVTESLSPHDKRENTVVQFERRYHIDADQAQRVAQLAAQFMRDLPEPMADQFEETARYVNWAARLHECGLTIAHNGYHKHSAYIAANADMPGFSRDEQKRLAFLILGHAGKLPKLARADPVPLHDWLAVLCLRLATLFHRSRQLLPPPDARLSIRGHKLTLNIDPAWLQSQPLTEYSLAQEIEQWQALGSERPFKIELASGRPAVADSQRPPSTVRSAS